MVSGQAIIPQWWRIFATDPPANVGAAAQKTGVVAWIAVPLERPGLRGLTVAHGLGPPPRIFIVHPKHLSLQQFQSAVTEETPVPSSSITHTHHEHSHLTWKRYLCPDLHIGMPCFILYVQPAPDNNFQNYYKYAIKIFYAFIIVVYHI
jgi:hypothetical protein